MHEFGCVCFAQTPLQCLSLLILRLVLFGLEIHSHDCFGEESIFVLRVLLTSAK